MNRSTFRHVALAIASSLLLSSEVAAQNCPPSYEFGSDNVDFYDPDPLQQTRIRNIEHNHMNEGVRSLRKGQSTASVSGDLRFVLSIVPNHADALSLLLRLALRDHKDKLPEMEPYTVECWLHRASVFSPNDVTANLVYGVYLSRKGRVKEAIVALESADKLKPNDPNVTYNLGLLYFEQRDYARSLEYAKRAYAAGFPLQGLRDKLKQAGQWSD